MRFTLPHCDPGVFFVLQPSDDGRTNYVQILDNNGGEYYYGPADEVGEYLGWL